MDLAEFLLARIAEDEEAMGRIAGRQWYACDDGHVQEPEIDDRDAWNAGPDDVIEARLPNHHNSWALVLDPARVLAECEAKRRVVAEHGEGRPWSPAQNPGRCRVCTAISDHGGTARFRAPCPTLRLLALPYASHPDYRSEWAP